MIHNTLHANFKNENKQREVFVLGKITDKLTR